VSGVHFLEFNDGRSFCEAYRTLSDETTYDALVTRAENIVLEKYSHSTLSTSMSKVVTYIDFKNGEFTSAFSRSHAPAE
jgi:hypothetical protein